MNYTNLVSLYDVKKKGLTNQNVDERLLTVSLSRSQDIDLSSVIGKKMLVDLQIKKAASTLNVKEKELIDDYILPYMAICIDIRAIDSLSNRIDNAGVGKVNATEFQNNQDEQNRKFRNSLKWDRDIITKDLTSFISGDKTSFPLYSGFGCDSSGGVSLLDSIITM